LPPQSGVQRFVGRLPKIDQAGAVARGKIQQQAGYAPSSSMGRIPPGRKRRKKQDLHIHILVASE
jgi:hypothetical protein